MLTEALKALSVSDGPFGMVFQAAARCDRFSEDRFAEAKLRAVLCEVTRDLSELELAGPDFCLADLQEVVDSAFDDYIEINEVVGQYYTTPDVARLMTELLDPQPGDSVFDPCCGLGGTLLACGRREQASSDESPHEPVRLCGADTDQNALLRAAIRWPLPKAPARHAQHGHTSSRWLLTGSCGQRG